MPDTIAFLFPGQGSQSVGMRGKLGALSAAQQARFDEADAVLGFPLTRLIDEGPEAELTATANAQPALLAAGLAAADGLAARGLTAGAVLGHSLGEYAALVWAGSLGYADALRLVRRRGELMAEAAARTPGKMAAVVKVPAERLQALVDELRPQGVIEITNFNSPDQLVLSGESAPVEAAVKLVGERRLGRAMLLNVSAPFHSSLMAPAQEAFGSALAAAALAAPGTPFIDNVTGEPEADPERIREKLRLQIVRPVQWERSVRTAIRLGVTRFVESGPGSVLTGLVRRIAPGSAAQTGESVLAAP